MKLRLEISELKATPDGVSPHRLYAGEREFRRGGGAGVNAAIAELTDYVEAAPSGELCVAIDVFANNDMIGDGPMRPVLHRKLDTTQAAVDALVSSWQAAAPGQGG